MKYSGSRRRIWVSVTHGIILFILLWCINNTSYSSAVDEALLKKIFIVEELILPNHFKLPNNIVFINVSKDPSLIADPVEYGQIPIADRQKLGAFFKILAQNNNQHRFVLCDLFFDYPSPDDSLFMAELNSCKRILLPYEFGSHRSQQAAIKVPVALSEYQTYNDHFSKFKLVYNDSLPTVPVRLYQELDKGDKLHWNDLHAISPRYYIRPYHLFESKQYPYYNLGELLMLSEMSNTFYTDYLKNKLIIIGNYDSDVHNTPIGKVPGPIILLNTYLSLKAGRARISFGWMLFMLVCLSITSYLLFFVKIKAPEMKVSPWIDFIIHNFLNNIFSFLGICSLIVFLSELCFFITLIISPLFFYLVYMSWCISYYNEHIKMQTT